MADTTKIPRVPLFSYRYNTNFATTATMLDTDKSDLITTVGATTAYTITLPPILNNVRAIKIDVAGAPTGATITLAPGANGDTYALDTINGTTSYAISAGTAL